MAQDASGSADSSGKGSSTAKTLLDFSRTGQGNQMLWLGLAGLAVAAFLVGWFLYRRK